MSSRCAIPAFLLRAFVFAFATIFWVAHVHADQSLRFVWVADTRGDANNDVIDTTVLTPIVNSILALNPAPKVVIFGGDAAYRGGTANLTEFQAVFTNRLTAAGIPSAFAIGNHELYTTNANPLDINALARQRDFQALFNGGWRQNGPAGFTNLAFSFQVGNSLFIIADSYYAPADGSTPVYGINSAQQAWITGLLQRNTASHTFVLTHIPAFHPWVPSAAADMADTWQTITTSGSATNTNASILFAGHEHLYYRTLHDGTYQVLAGSAGAPLGCDSPPCPIPGPVYPGDVFALSYNYAVVSINGRYVTVNVFNEANQSLDAFQFFDNSGVQNSVINNTTAIVGPQPAGILAGSGNTIDNSAAITNVTTGIDAVSNNNITNSGSITPSSGGNGIYVYDNNTITNTTAGRITGNSTGLWGIRVNSANTIVNHGTVAVSGASSLAFLAEGDGNTLTNNGTLGASGADSYAAMFLGTGNTLVNNGIVDGRIALAAGPGVGFANNGWFGIGSAGAGTTHTVGGTFAQTSAGTLALRVAPNGVADTLQVTGPAQLAGTAQVIFQPGTPSRSYTILSATGGRSGTFDTLATQNMPALFSAGLGYSATDVTLNLQATMASMPGLGGNQIAVGRAIDAAFNVGSGLGAMPALLGLTASQIPHALSVLSGSNASVGQSAALAAGGQFASLMTGRAGTRRSEELATCNKESGSACEPSPDWSAWATAFGGAQWLNADAATGSDAAQQNIGGAAAGGDYRVGPATLVGFAIGLSDSNYSVSATGASGRATGAHFGVYGQHDWRTFYVNAALAYSRFDGTATRPIAGIGTTETAKSSAISSQLAGRLEIGRPFDLGPVAITPFAALQPAGLWSPGVIETSATVIGGPGVFALTYQPQSTASLPTFLGVQLDAETQLDSRLLKGWLRLAWMHEFLADRSVTAGFTVLPGSSFTVDGARAASDSARIDFGVKYEVGTRTSLFANGRAELSDRGLGIAGTAGLRVVW